MYLVMGNSTFAYFKVLIKAGNYTFVTNHALYHHYDKYILHCCKNVLRVKLGHRECNESGVMLYSCVSLRFRVTA